MSNCRLCVTEHRRAACSKPIRLADASTIRQCGGTTAGRVTAGIRRIEIEACRVARAGHGSRQFLTAAPARLARIGRNRVRAKRSRLRRRGSFAVSTTFGLLECRKSVVCDSGVRVSDDCRPRGPKIPVEEAVAPATGGRLIGEVLRSTSRCRVERCSRSARVSRGDAATFRQIDTLSKRKKGRGATEHRPEERESCADALLAVSTLPDARKWLWLVLARRSDCGRSLDPG